jgi:P pilus assembly chaperone PapD
MRFKIFLFLLLFFTAEVSSLQADLLISPTRVFFGPRERVQKVILKNTSNQKKTYKVFFKSLQMDRMGIYHEIKPDQVPVEFEGLIDNAASPYIRYSPRMVSIKPNEAQTIRLFLRRKPGMDLKEYRSHLAFKEVPPQDFGRVIGSDNKETNKVQLLTLFEVTIPVLVKNAPEDIEVSIDQLQVVQKDGKTFMRSVFNRQGGTSAYGNILVRYQKEEGAEFQDVGAVNRFFVYYPGSERQIDIPIQTEENVDLTSGVLQVRYYRLKSDGGKLIAASTLQLK